MRRIKPNGSCVYHIFSRVAHREFLLDDREKSIFVNIMRRTAFFSGVEILTYCVMTNHFHILLRVPEKQEIDDATVLARVRVLYGEDKFAKLIAQFKQWEELNLKIRIKETLDNFRARMYDISEFGKTLKHYVSNSYNKRNEHEGTLWSGRFGSTVVEDNKKALMAVGAYIDLNPVRAKMASDPAQYAWSGFGAASAGVKAARENLQNLLAGLSWDEVKSEYQAYLDVRAGRDGNGKTYLRQLMYSHRIAYFTKGAVIGSKQFINEIMEDYMLRSSGGKAVPFRNMQSDGMAALRDIRKNTITQSS